MLSGPKRVFVLNSILCGYSVKQTLCIYVYNLGGPALVLRSFFFGYHATSSRPYITLFISKYFPESKLYKNYGSAYARPTTLLALSAFSVVLS